MHGRAARIGFRRRSVKARGGEIRQAQLRPHVFRRLRNQRRHQNGDRAQTVDKVVKNAVQVGRRRAFA